MEIARTELIDDWGTAAEGAAHWLVSLDEEERALLGATDAEIRATLLRLLGRMFAELRRGKCGRSVDKAPAKMWPVA